MNPYLALSCVALFAIALGLRAGMIVRRRGANLVGSINTAFLAYGIAGSVSLLPAILLVWGSPAGHVWLILLLSCLLSIILAGLVGLIQVLRKPFNHPNQLRH